MDNVQSTMILLGVLMILAYIMGKIFEKMKLPALIGQILVGVIFVTLIIAFPEWSRSTFGFTIDGDPTKGIISMTESFQYQFFYVIGEFGMVFLMFNLGLETKLTELVKTPKAAYYIAIVGVVIPLLCGLGLGLAMGWNSNQSLLLATALFAMSTAVTIAVLTDLKAMDSKEAKIIISASVIDDIICLTLLAIVSGIVQGGSSTEALIKNVIMIVAFIAAAFLITWKIKPITKFVMNIFYIPNKVVNAASGGKTHYQDEFKIKKETSQSATMLAVMVCVVLAVVSTNIGLSSVIGAFIAGMVFAEFKEEFPCEEPCKAIEMITIPFFFIFVGMNIRYDQIFSTDNLLFDIVLPTIAICVVAILSKFIGGYLGGKAGKLDKDTCILMGCAMVPRGEVGVLVAQIGLTSAVFVGTAGMNMYTEIILMTVITSIVAPILVKWAWRRLKRKQGESAGGAPPTTIPEEQTQSA